MKIAITGHTRGIGKAVFDSLSLAGHDCSGYSRSNGFDISDIDKLMQAVINHDVLINNAYHQFYQIDIFNQWYSKHQHNDTKTIINIGSIIKNTMPNGTAATSKEYIACKKQLDFITKKAAMTTDRQCRIININPGFVKTELSQKYSGINNEYPSLDVQQCADAVCWALDQPPGVEISEITLKAVY